MYRSNTTKSVNKDFFYKVLESELQVDANASGNVLH